MPVDLLTPAERAEFLAAHPAWKLDGGTLICTYTFSDFVEAFSFVARVALLAEKAFHHPDIQISWNKVTLRLTTHSAGGLTSRDIDLAASIDA
ncbi:MAG: 4a-hydroxytetrahydrobiopterin dehydratase [Acidimicrobiia bacterium]